MTEPKSPPLPSPLLRAPRVKFREFQKYILKRRELHFFHLSNKKSAEDGTLSTFIKLTYCAPTFSTLPIVLLLAVYGTQFYEKLGASLAYLSFFIALARSFDVVSDPIMSYLTDSMRSKHGRRRPFLITGCWLYAGFMYLLLSPPELESDGLSLWFGLFYILFFLSSTYTNIPYDALGPELTDNYDDRSRLFFVSGLFDGFGSLVAVLFPVMLTNYINFTRKCPDSLKSCYSPSGVGTSCYANFGTDEYTTYDISANFSTNVDMYNTTGCSDSLHHASLTHVNFCICVQDCKNRCGLENERTAYGMVGAFFALWYVVFMINCVYNIKERCQLVNEYNEHRMKKAPPIVPSMLNTMKNQAFTCLLPAWVCDAVVNAIIASMMTYYVRYVIEPEFSNGCDNGRSGKWFCNSQYVLGASVTCLLLSAFCSMPIWLLINRKFGKRNAWLLWSFTMATTNILFIFLGRGDYVWCIIISSINGIPFGAKFLADAILSDIIDYDEFLTGARSEATYTMFKSFLPKICAIPSAAIPIAILNSLGHIAPVNGAIQLQPSIIKTYIRVVTVIVPTAVSTVGFYVKMKFPLKNKEQVDMITSGVATQMAGKPAPDPITKVLISKIEISDKDQEELYRLDFFPGLRFVTQLEHCINSQTVAVFLKKLTIRKRNHFYISVATYFLFCLISILSFDLMASDSLSFIPVVSIICVGVSITATLFCYQVYTAAIDLERNPPTLSIVEKAIEQRKNILKSNPKLNSSPSSRLVIPTAEDGDDESKDGEYWARTTSVFDDKESSEPHTEEHLSRRATKILDIEEEINEL